MDSIGVEAEGVEELVAIEALEGSDFVIFEMEFPKVGHTFQIFDATDAIKV